MFEGENSSLRKSFEHAIMRDKQKAQPQNNLNSFGKTSTELQSNVGYQDILEDFDKKKFKFYDTYNNDFICINDHPLSDEIKDFLSASLSKVRQQAYEEGVLYAKKNNICDEDGCFEKVREGGYFCGFHSDNLPI